MKKTQTWKRITIIQAKKYVKALGFTLYHQNGEFRVIDPTLPLREQEDMAYYTVDIQDAIDTVRVMFLRRS